MIFEARETRKTHTTRLKCILKSLPAFVDLQQFQRSPKKKNEVINILVCLELSALAIQPTLGEWRPASRKSRRKQVVISRLRIGHTRLTHSFILKQEPQPQCSTCQTTCTVKNILIEGRTFAVIRKRFFKVNNLTDLFENVKIDDILSFLRKTELYQKI